MPKAEAQGIVTRPAYIALLLTSTALTLGAFFYPLFTYLGYPKSALIAKLCYAPVCHQLPDRSFTLFSYPVAVCERCFAVYLAFMLYTWLYPMLRYRYEVTLKTLLIPLLLMLLPLIDWLLDATGLVANTMISRTITGFLAGLGIAYIAIPAWLEAMTSPSFATKTDTVHHG